MPDPSSQYELVFCELKNRGKFPLAPALEEFRKNPPDMQYLLLKRHAQRNRLKIEAPTQDDKNHTTGGAVYSRQDERQDEVLLPPVETGDSETDSRPASVHIEAGGTDKALPMKQVCKKNAGNLFCDNRLFRLQGNRRNASLEAGVLDDDFRMDLPRYSPVYPSVADYLGVAYLRYIERMHAIGLSGATLSYSKFAGIFVVSQKDHSDFVARFETMFRFLKIDKKTMGVREAITMENDFSVQNCSMLSDRFVVCDSGKANYVFMAEAD
ncbi:MAG: hypothetical protein KDI30_10095 [Pseudomonadales bacterium]|nr:hypothetical protein [Pseudomonadales bacterium]